MLIKSRNAVGVQVDIEEDDAEEGPEERPMGSNLSAQDKPDSTI